MAAVRGGIGATTATTDGERVDGGEQLALSGLPSPRRRRVAVAVPITEHLPVAEVVVERSQPHLDRVFEYAVPVAFADQARPGVRVRVRFGGQDLDGYLLARRATATHGGVLTPLRRVVSPERVLDDDVLALARAVAARYAGSLADVLRLAVPPRHARVEAEQWVEPDATEQSPQAPQRRGASVSAASRDPLTGTARPDPWSGYPGAGAFLRRIRDGQAPRAAWQALPGPAGQQWADAIAVAVGAARAGGRGSLVVVPSAAQVVEVERALTAAGVPAWAPGSVGGWVRLVADAGPAGRYRSFLAASRGLADVVVGTRAAAFAPVRRLGLVVCWDEADHLHTEPRAPYPHARETLALRSEAQGAALLVGGFVRSAVVQRWVQTGWAHPLLTGRETVRARTPRVTALTSVELAREGPAGAARLPGAAWRALHDGLARGPVLVQVPRAGYLPAVACRRCRATARCPACSGPLHVPRSTGGPQCRWCGRLATDWRCPECSDTGLRSVRVGSERTAEELGRAFPGARLVVSGAAGGVVERVGTASALVVATPGAEPRADGGYAAAVLLDAATVTARPGLDAAEQAVKTWLGAAVLVRPVGEGGVVLLVGDGAPVPTQALVRWDPAGLAERELAERTELGLPPAVHLVAVEGQREAVEAVVAGLGGLTTVLGPLPVDDPTARPRGAEQGVLDTEMRRQVRALLRTPWASSGVLVAELAAVLATRSARRETPVRVQVEPLDIV